MDSLALPSVPSNRVSLREELEALPTAALKAQLANTLGLTARHLLRLAMIVAILEDRGEDLSAMKGGLLTVLRKIACGELLPDLVVLFASEPAKIQQAAKLPVAEQAEIAAGRAQLPSRVASRPAERNESAKPKRSHHAPDGPGRPVPYVKPVAASGVGAAGTPRDVGETAAEMILACADPETAVQFLAARLREGGLAAADVGPTNRPAPAKVKELPALAVDPTAHERLVIKFALRFGADRRAVKESWQYAEGMVALVKAARDFKPELGFQFSTLACRYIQTAIMRENNARRTDKRVVNEMTTPFSQFGDGEGRPLELATDNGVGPDNPEAAEAVARLMASLNERSRRLVERVLIQGWSCREAGEAETPPISHQRVWMLIEAAKERMRKCNPKPAHPPGYWLDRTKFEEPAHGP